MECTCILKFSKWAPLPWKPDDLWKTSIGCFWLPAQQIFMKLYSNYPCIECNWYMQKNQERFDKYGRRCHRNKKGGGNLKFFYFSSKFNETSHEYYLLWVNVYPSIKIFKMSTVAIETDDKCKNFNWFFLCICWEYLSDTLKKFRETLWTFFANFFTS